MPRWENLAVRIEAYCSNCCDDLTVKQVCCFPFPSSTDAAILPASQEKMLLYAQLAGIVDSPDFTRS